MLIATFFSRPFLRLSARVEQVNGGYLVTLSRTDTKEDFRHSGARFDDAIDAIRYAQYLACE